MIQRIVDKQQSLKEFTDNACAQASFCFAYLLKNKEIKVNGKKTGENIILQAGDTVQYYLTQKQQEKPAFYPVYQDEHVLIIDKESGVNSEAVFTALAEKYENCRFIHRLDRNTKGLMVFALDERSEQTLLNVFKHHSLEKKYHVLCFGTFPKEKEVLTGYLKKNAEKSLVYVYDTPVGGAERIVTEYTVLQSKQGISKAEITLHTGKTHQIRAHLAHIGCPVVGDMKYGNTLQNKSRGVARQCLVAKSLRFSFENELAYLNEKQFVSRFDVEI